MTVLRTRTLPRAAVLILAAGASLWLLAAPALAHVEVSAKPAQAGAANAVVSFDAEGESTTAGITGVRIQLPSGIAADQVKLEDGPSGWKLTAAQGVVTIAGPALKPGANAEYAVRVATMPNAAQVLFKTIVSYSDGHKDSWIEEPTAGGEPDNPAPVLKLAPAAPTTAAAPTTTPAAPTTTAAPTTAAPTTAAAPVADDGDGGSTALGVVVGIVVVLAIAGVVAYVIRRRNAAA